MPIPIRQDNAEEKEPREIPYHRTSPRVDFISPPTAGIGAVALHQFMGNAFLEEMKQLGNNYHPLGPEEVTNCVVHLVTKETITKYKTLFADPRMHDMCSTAICRATA